MRYLADRRDKPHRVILVVKERADAHLLDRVLPVISGGWMAELCHDVLFPVPPSTNRAKPDWQSKTPKLVTPAIDAFACNEVRLFVVCPTYQIMPVARRVFAKTTGTGWSQRQPLL